MDPYFYFLPRLPSFQFCPTQLGLVVSSVPMHLYPPVITDQPDPNSILIHHFSTRLPLEQCRRKSDTLGFVSTSQWSPTLNSGFLASWLSFFHSFQSLYKTIISFLGPLEKWYIKEERSATLPRIAPTELSSTQPPFQFTRGETLSPV